MKSRVAAVSIAACLSFQPAIANMGVGSMAPAAGLAGMCGMICSMLGITEIGTGNQNMANGQQTQNQAQMAMGAMQIAQGLLGLAAAAAAAGMQGKGNSNASKMGSTGYNPGAYQSTIGTSPTPASGGSTTGGASDTGVTETGNTVTLSPESLRNGQLGAALTNIEKTYGIPRDDFVKALQNGADPKALLAAAPKNAPSMELLSKIEAGLAAQYAAKSAEALAAAGNGSGASTNLASVGGAGTGGAPSGSEEAKGPRMPASTAPPDEALDDLDNPANANLSPEVKAALAAKAARIKAEKEMKEMHGWSIFQLVHNRYKKLEPMLYGRVERTNVKPIPSEL